ncbi:MAG TPA: glycosyl hydrolase family 8 [Chlamydiales bacterium]|jgi:endo-1,4-beta-D-glucanase Y|nr:glycosyl hydrolase family 8 [Chlamydiales bacterium]
MYKIASIIFPLLIAFTGVEAAGPNYPFPTYATTTYYPGVIMPSNVSKAAMATKIQTLYTFWKQEYLRTMPDAPDQMYVFYNEDGESEPKNAVAVSEGQGYGMILSAYMAGYDAEAQTIFDNLFRFCRAFESVITPSLIGWQQVEEDGVIDYNPDGGDDSATDGDMDVAYALLLANKQWGSTGGINYLEEAERMISDMITADVNLEKFTLTLGDWVEEDDPPYTKATRPSDFMLNHLKIFAAVSGDTRWNTVTDKCYSIINELYDHYAPNTGLLPDFAQYENGAYVPADEDFLERIEDGFYSWNACRTPWRIALDYILTGDIRAINQLTKLNSWIRSATNGLASDVNAGYELDGTLLPDEEGDFFDDLAFTTPFAVSAMINSTNQAWLNALWTYTSNYPSDEANYFANSLRLLSLLVVSGNWWTPLNLP